MSQKPSILGSIVERKPGSTNFSAPKSAPSTGKTGFPPVQHRSKSAFSRSRELQSKAHAPQPRSNQVPSLVPAKLRPKLSEIEDDWRDHVSRENEARVAGMTDEEREEERRQILERFGANIGDVLARARIAREKQKLSRPSSHLETSIEDAIPVIHEERKHVERATSPPPSAMASPGGSRPSSRADRRLRFAELEPDDVFVYEGAPHSPKRRVLALPPPDGDSDTVSLGQFQGKLEFDRKDDIGLPGGGDDAEDNVEEGTPEYIRRHYFPDAPKNDPNVSWMQISAKPEPSTSSSSSLRFDLYGNPIPPSISLSLPTHLGLHHHAEGAHAGYTLDDIFLLSRSTVPAQRATMLGVLARIAANLAKGQVGRLLEGMEVLAGHEEDWRKRIVAAGLEALGQRGGVGARAIEVIWQSIVHWDLQSTQIEGTELSSKSTSLVDNLPVEDFLPQIATLLAQGDVLPESADQLLSILHRLAQQSNKIASIITLTPNLLSTTVQTYLLAPPITDPPFLPNPGVLQLLYTLASSSRSNAEVIQLHAGSLLRYLTFLPPTSPYSPSLTITLLTHTLRLYAILASYGLLCNIAGQAVEPLARLERYIISRDCTSDALRKAWVRLVEVWTICAIDPHQTTPPHSIRWSQVVGWGWMAGLTELQSCLGYGAKDWQLWASLWGARAAFLEGSKVNGVRGGEAERSEFLSIASGFSGGKEGEMLNSVLSVFEQGLQDLYAGQMDRCQQISDCAQVLASVIRLWLGCLTSHTEKTPLSPPFPLPFRRLSSAVTSIVYRPIMKMWYLDSSPKQAVLYRQLSNFLSRYLQLSKRLPHISEDMWIAESFSVVMLLGPGDEDAAVQIVKEASIHLTPDWTQARGLGAPPTFWERGGFTILEPFFLSSVKPPGIGYIGPIVASPSSIKTAAVQRLPTLDVARKDGLPLHRDWTMAPLDHLLRSADSPVFTSLATSWNASENDITIAALYMTCVVQVVLQRFSSPSLCLSREETTFACMKVFMLEHGQLQTDSSEEVFRDPHVERLMKIALQPYEFGPGAQPTTQFKNGEDLEKVAARFLGPSVPFFQYYTDFVALYDSISFSQQEFARLLLPPISMRYAQDYRKHLWCDFGHIVRTIRVKPLQVLSNDLREYFCPIETDEQIIGSYLASLLKGNCVEFMRLVALHHISSNIWQDLRDVESWKGNRAAQLLEVIVRQGDADTVREVVRYRQARIGLMLLPPACFEDVKSLGGDRLRCTREWLGDDVARRLEGLFEA